MTGAVVELEEEVFPLVTWFKKLVFMKEMLHVLRNTLIQKIKTSDSGHQWKTVLFVIFINSIILAYFARDKVNGDPYLGVFGVFDGHGGRQVADHCAERIPDELRKEIAKCSGDLSLALE